MQKRRPISAASISFSFDLAYVDPRDVPSKHAVPLQLGAQVLGILNHLFSFSYPYRALQYQLISSNIS
jgi:hypothetical protein